MREFRSPDVGKGRNGGRVYTPGQSILEPVLDLMGWFSLADVRVGTLSGIRRTLQAVQQWPSIVPRGVHRGGGCGTRRDVTEGRGRARAVVRRLRAVGGAVTFTDAILGD